MNLKLLFFCVGILISLNCLSQDLKCTVVSVNEERSSYNDADEYMTIDILIEGLTEGSKNSLFLQDIKKALDDNGDSLVLYTGEDRAKNSWGGYKLSVNLGIAKREAREITLLEGELLFHEPTISNGSLVEITSLKFDTLNDLLAPYNQDFSLHMISHEKFYEASDSVIAEYFSQEIADSTSKEEMVELMNQMQEFSEMIRESNIPGKSFYFKISDGSRVEKITIVDANGEKISVGNTHLGSGFLGFTLERPLLSDDKLQVAIADDDAAYRIIPFRIEHIALP